MYAFFFFKVPVVLAWADITSLTTRTAAVDGVTMTDPVAAVVPTTTGHLPRYVH